MEYVSPEHHPAFEEYAEAIYELAEDGIDVIQARIAERLRVTRPSVSETIHRMERGGLVSISDAGELSLTSDGEILAVAIVRRHRLAERFLTDVLGLSWAQAHTEAGRWEHVISPAVEVAMTKVLNDPTTCPHGNPIPGTAYCEPDNTVTLSEVAAGSEFTVVRIPEELEFEDGQLEFLEASGLIPGRTGLLLTVAPDGTATVEIDQAAVGLGGATAERIVVVETVQ